MNSATDERAMQASLERLDRVAAALIRHALAQSRIFQEFLRANYRAGEAENTAGRLLKRSADADAALAHETGEGAE